jgi:hypothetical protein
MATRSRLYWEIGVFLGSLSLFGAILVFGIGTDIQIHADVIRRVREGSLLPPANFLYYLVVSAITLFGTSKVALYVASSITLATAETAKFTITRKIVAKYCSGSLGGGHRPGVMIPLFSVLLLVAFSLPANAVLKNLLLVALGLPTGNLLKEHFYLGQIPPNVWHNSTTIFLMPFALLLFWLSYEQLIRPTRRGVVLITVLCMLNVLAKPSFFFVFSVAYPIMLARCFGLGRKLWWNLLPVAVGTLLVGGMYFLIYRLNFGSPQLERSGIAVRPLLVWSHYSTSIAVSLASSLMFVIVYSCFNWRDLTKSLLFQYALVAYLIAVGIFSLLIETGSREFHANFFWQCVVCSYLLFMVVLMIFSERVGRIGMRGWKEKVILLTFLAHVISGAGYLVRLFATGSYF